jgi:hypothetical protein
MLGRCESGLTGSPEVISSNSTITEIVMLISRAVCSHVAYATIPFEPYADPVVTRPYTPELQRGKCPETHPVHLPQLMFEVMFDTRPWNNKDLWPEDGSQPFVFSMGDA